MVLHKIPLSISSLPNGPPNIQCAFVEGVLLFDMADIKALEYSTMKVSKHQKHFQII